MEGIDDILDFWFGTSDSTLTINSQQSALWWSKNEQVDEQISHRFLPVLNAVSQGQMESWNNTPKGMLASIICLDQFPRNIFRGEAESFAYDGTALRLARDLTEKTWDKELPDIYRVFAYLPFEHSENFEDQKMSLQLYHGLRQDVSQELGQIFDGFYDFALKHYQIIDRFGRFPHRNTIVGRESTVEEQQFLSQPGSSF